MILDGFGQNRPGISSRNRLELRTVWPKPSIIRISDT